MKKNKIISKKTLIFNLKTINFSVFYYFCIHFIESVKNLGMKTSLFTKLKKQKSYNTFHKKNKFSQRDVEEILRKVKYGVPTFYSKEPDINSLKSLGVEISKSIYVERFENLDFSYVKSLYLAQKIVGFNLVIIFQKGEEVFRFRTYPIKAYFFQSDKLSKKQKEALYCLNINCDTEARSALNAEDKIEIKGAKIVAKNVVNSGLVSTYKGGESYFSVTQNYLEGKFVFVNNLIKNPQKHIFLFKKTIKFDFLNYFYIKKIKNGYFLKNITSGKVYYFLSNCQIKNFSFQKIKNTNNFQISVRIGLQKGVKLCVYFGGKQVKIKDDFLQEKVQSEIQNIFNFKISTNEPKMDFYINKIIPDLALKNIVENEIDISKIRKVRLKSIKQILYFYKYKKLTAEEAFFAIKGLLFELSDKVIYFKKNDLKNYRLEIVFCGKVKSFVVDNEKTKGIVIDGVEYKNCFWVELGVLKKYNNFSLSL